MSSLKVIIFGATGAVGRAAAAEAHRRGAQVTLAMRDVSKTIAGLPELPRLQADLSDPTSIKEAVQKSGATAAFVYTMDDMGSTFKALKDSGIDYVVLLSSWTIYPNDPETATRSHAIPAKHAKAEIALQVSGLKFTAIRPLYFASNVCYEKAGIKRGQIDVLNPDGVWDYIAPEDIGTVAGAKLFSEAEIVPIMGAELISQRTAWKIIERELNLQIKLEEVDFSEFVKSQDPFARSLGLGTVQSDEDKYPSDRCKLALSNVRKYASKDPMTFSEWVKTHRKDICD